MLPDRLLRFTDANDLRQPLRLLGNRRWQAAHGFDFSNLDCRRVPVCREAAGMQLHRSGDLSVDSISAMAVNALFGAKKLSLAIRRSWPAS